MIKEIYPHHLACLTFRLNVTSKSVVAKKKLLEYSCLVSKQIDKPIFRKFLEQLLDTKILKQNKRKSFFLKLHKVFKLRSHKYKLSWKSSNLINILS